MEKWRPYCNSHLANQTHETTTDFLASFPPSIVTGGENKPYSQFRKAADAIALVAAREQDAQNVSACAIEVNESGGFIIRVAQNRKVQRADLERVKRILDAAAGAVDAKGADEWKMMSKKDKTHATATLAKNLIFPMIVENCRAKISASLTLGRTSPSFSAWLDQADLSRVDEDHRDLILQWFTAIRSSNDLSAVLWSAYLMEPYLATLDAPQSIELTFGKLTRYITAGIHIVGCFVALRKRHPDTPAAGSFAIATLPINQTVTTPEADGEPNKFDLFMKESFGISGSGLNTFGGRLDKTRNVWSVSTTKPVLFFHVELQMACFYALNPDLYPVGGYIAVSKLCCQLCDFVLKSMQKTPSTCHSEYTSDATGPPHFFYVRGTHGDPSQNWWYPDLAVFERHAPTAPVLDSDRLRQLERRLSLIRLELSASLKAKAGAVLEQLKVQPPRDPESGGHSSDSSDDLCETIRQEYLLLVRSSWEKNERPDRYSAGGKEWGK